MNKKEIIHWVSCKIEAQKQYLKIMSANEIDSLVINLRREKVEKDEEVLEDILKLLMKDFEKQPILTDEEREYLKNVLKPFKNRILYIKKRNDGVSGSEYLHFKLMCGNDDTYFLYFKKGTMYKNMVNGKEYTLKELGIEEE